MSLIYAGVLFKNMKQLTRTMSIETLKKVGEIVLLQGWVDVKRDHGKISFIDLRDRTGKVQCVGIDKMSNLVEESVVELSGVVKLRPEKMVNPDIETGTVEVEVQEYKVLNKIEELPIPVNGDG